MTKYFLNCLMAMVLTISLQSFVNSDGTLLSFDQLKLSSKGKILIIFSSSISCRDCYALLSKKICRLQKKENIKVYVLAEFKENAFQRRMSIAELKRNFKQELDETYIFEEKHIRFMDKYLSKRSPSLLYINNGIEEFISYENIFFEKKLDKIFKED